MLCNAYDDMASFSYHNTRGVTAVGDIYPDMDLLHMDNQLGNPISRDLVESIRRHQQTPQGDEIDGEDEDETFLEYHSPDEGNTSEERQ
jgi:hypothetical protein